MGNNIQGIWKEAVNANLTLYFLLLGTSPLTVIPTTTNRKELVEKGQGRKGEEEAQFELISKVNKCVQLLCRVKKCALGLNI